MLLEINMQFNMVIFSFSAGLITGILFDVYRIIRNLNSIKVIEIIEDVLFWILAALIVFTFLLYFNYAFLTPYVYMFIIIGLLVYFKFISKYFYKIERKIVNILSTTIRVIIKNLLYPMKLVIYKLTDRKK